MASKSTTRIVERFCWRARRLLRSRRLERVAASSESEPQIPAGATWIAFRQIGEHQPLEEGRMLRHLPCASLSVLLGATALFGSAHADEGGVGFWFPGTFGSLAATPGEPGWSAASFYIHSSV